MALSPMPRIAWYAGCSAIVLGDDRNAVCSCHSAASESNSDCNGDGVLSSDAVGAPGLPNSKSIPTWVRLGVVFRVTTPDHEPAVRSSESSTTVTDESTAGASGAWPIVAHLWAIELSCLVGVRVVMALRGIFLRKAETNLSPLVYLLSDPLVQVDRFIHAHQDFNFTLALYGPRAVATNLRSKASVFDAMRYAPWRRPPLRVEGYGELLVWCDATPRTIRMDYPEEWAANEIEGDSFRTLPCGHLPRLPSQTSKSIVARALC